MGVRYVVDENGERVSMVLNLFEDDLEARMALLVEGNR